MNKYALIFGMLFFAVTFGGLGHALLGTLGLVIGFLGGGWGTYLLVIKAADAPAD